MTRVFFLSVVVCCSAWLSTPALSNDAGENLPNDQLRPKVRNFEFVYGGKVTGLKSGQTARIWLPVAKSSHVQQVELTKTNLSVDFQMTTERKFGNKTVFFEAQANDQGEIPFELVYQVKRYELTKSNQATVDEKEAKSLYLSANQLVPLAPELYETIMSSLDLRSKELSSSTMEQARILYDAVDSHMKYDKPTGGDWGRGDALWACNSKYGNCTDFHSVFISACRFRGLPARFEIGFSIPPEWGEGIVGGYHCWAQFANGDKWVPVDISEADKHPDLKQYYFGNLTEDRVTFTVGRDLELVPATAAKKVNFHVYPYVEVDGKQHTSFEKGIRYKDSPVSQPQS